MENERQCENAVKPNTETTHERERIVQDQAHDNGVNQDQRHSDDSEENQKHQIGATQETLRQQLDDSISRHEALAIKLQAAELVANKAIEQSQRLQAQLLSLKQDMAMSNRVVNQATDQEVVEKMIALNHELQNWIVNNFRRIKIDAADVSAEMMERFNNLPLLTNAHSLRSMYSEFDIPRKLFAFHATAMYLIMRVFENGYFFGLPAELIGIRNAVLSVKGPTAAYNEWRSQTFRFLQTCEIDVRCKLDRETLRQKNRLVDDIASTMTILTGSQLNEDQIKSLSSIVDHAASLSRLLSVQRAEYRCVFSDADASGKLLFDRHMMEDILVGATEGRVQCVVFPAVLKSGDERGENMHLQNVVMRAKVVCFEDVND